MAARRRIDGMNREGLAAVISFAAAPGCRECPMHDRCYLDEEDMSCPEMLAAYLLEEVPE